jgi:hypothetical protein
MYWIAGASERLITVDVLGITNVQDLDDECGFTKQQCNAVLLDDVPGEPSMERNTRAHILGLKVRV